VESKPAVSKTVDVQGELLSTDIVENCDIFHFILCLFFRSPFKNFIVMTDDQ